MKEENKKCDFGKNGKIRILKIIKTVILCMFHHKRNKSSYFIITLI